MNYFWRAFVNIYFVIPMTLRLLLASFLLMSVQVNAASIKVPGTSLSITSPAGFTLSEDFKGFEDVQTKSSIMIVEFPKESYSVLAELFLDINKAKAQFDHQGVSILDRKDILLNINKAKLLFLSGIQAYKDKEVIKYIGLIEGDMTLLISYNIFDKEAFPESIIIDSMKSISLGE